MFLQINFKSALPVYAQIVEQVKNAAATGVLKPGEPLPAIRPLAEELKVNRNTISKAYAELEQEGIVELQPGRGCFVSENHSPYKRDLCRKMIADEIDRIIVQAYHYQIDTQELLSLISKRIDHFHVKQESSPQGKP